MDGWERKALRAAEFVAYPALAGAAFCLLTLGVVTWLPALAAAGHALQSWRSDGSGRPFTGTLRAFPGYWRQLRREALAGTAVLVVCAADVAFLATSRGPALVLLPVQVLLLAAVVVYGLALATVAALEPGSGAGKLRRDAVAFAFGSPRRTLGLAAAAVVLPLAVLPVPLGPLLLGPTLPLMAALSVAAPAPRPGQPAGAGAVPAH